jgi:mannose-1-phosphate guanylyltransferase
VLEPRSAKGEAESEIYCLPADFAWTDIGSWAALHEHQVEMPELTGCGGANVVDAGQSMAIESFRNYVFAPGKAVVLLGVDDLVVVETEDSLLITTRAQSQNVGKVVKALNEAGRHDLT